MISETNLALPEKSAKILSPSAGFILLIFIVNIFLPPYAVTIVLFMYILFYLFSTGMTIPRDMMRLAVIPLLLILIGLAGSGANELYDVLKDVQGSFRGVDDQEEDSNVVSIGMAGASKVGGY